MADKNVEGHQARIEELLEPNGLRKALAELGVEFATFAEVGFERDIDDRTLWQRCQDNGWILFTDNRNDDGETSLQATLASIWSPGKLPVITLASKRRFEQNADYRKRVAEDVAQLLFSILAGDSRDLGSHLRPAITNTRVFSVVELSVELRDLADDISVAVASLTNLDFPERLVKMELALPITSLRLPHPGRYEMAVLFDGREVAIQFIDAEIFRWLRNACHRPDTR